MLHWLQQKLLRKNIIFTEFCILSTLIHFVFGCALFCMYKGYDSSLTLHVHASKRAHDVVVKLLPLTAKKSIQKRVAGRMGVVGGQQKTGLKKKVLSPTQLVKIKSVAPKKTIPVKKVVQITKKTKQIVQGAATKASAVEMTKSDTQVKESIKNSESSQNKIDHLPAATVSQQQDVPVTSLKGVENSQENVVYVTHKELDALQLEEALQNAIQSVWSPPAGIDKTVESEVLIRVDWEGNLLDVQFIKAANIVIYDVAVQEAVQEMEFPRQIWGKEIKIAFRP